MDDYHAATALGYWLAAVRLGSEKSSPGRCRQLQQSEEIRAYETVFVKLRAVLPRCNNSTFNHSMNITASRSINFETDNVLFIASNFGYTLIN